MKHTLSYVNIFRVNMDLFRATHYPSKVWQHRGECRADTTIVLQDQ